ncbi:hypothetical protein DM02DRAFT_280660 [Periconia macrospinosa]|uniref:Uncharacterized protein n=1 Tax=Periconia macrospinosa TaxID=97972 RepID=A0A2V1DXG4_9PLEO|nr:hypothetical protein DM02DRAFT_280660 [Periconia macrospinosa]
MRLLSASPFAYTRSNGTAQHSEPDRHVVLHGDQHHSWLALGHHFIVIGWARQQVVAMVHSMLVLKTWMHSCPEPRCPISHD